MDIIKTENLTFTYPGATSPAIRDICLSVKSGEFVTVCGKSGCGKSTLLRQFKPIVSPYGTRAGEVCFGGKPISEIPTAHQAQKIGFVMQNPDSQIVTDKVWHELAFGLENAGVPTPEIRARVAETASFFGIGDWFYKNTDELSGGQKQILNLASVMVMQPEILLLDEPTSQLDPIGAQKFLEILCKINRETGTTVILTEHRLEEAFAISDRIIVMENGEVVADDSPEAVGEMINKTGNDMFAALPVPMRVYYSLYNSGNCPITVRDGKKWLETVEINRNIEFDDYPLSKGESVLTAKDLWVRYSKNERDVLKGLSLDVKKGEIYALLGGNGEGKTTILSVIAGVLKAYRGKVSACGRVSMLPQNPQALFTHKTVELELKEMTDDYFETAELCGIEGLLNMHPYDLSGGEAQKVALAKVLLTNPEILLLDEPTKGLDAHYKKQFAEILKICTSAGKTIIMVSHDIEFCAEQADRCGLVFDGVIVSQDYPRSFFSGKKFYTTAANRMAGDVINKAITAEDIISACGGTIPPAEKYREKIIPQQNKKPTENKRKISVKSIITATICFALFIISHVINITPSGGVFDILRQGAGFIFLAVALTNLIPQKDFAVRQKNAKWSAKNILSALIVIVVVPLTICFGAKYGGGRKYLLVSLLVIAETLIPVFLLFEQRKPKARELVLISVVCALAVVGREAFFMFPQFKPMAAVVIITGVCFGAETGFLTGAVSAFVSNFFFGQSMMTPWQMMALGLVGFVGGILFNKGIIRLTKVNICLFGGLSVLIIYGGILNPASIFMWQSNPTKEMIIASYAAGLSFDITHAMSTIFFLWVISGGMIEKFERVKTKYDLMR